MMATRIETGDRALRHGELVLQGQRRFRLLPFLGPAFIACVAYIDPGNFATNIAGGSKYGYTLVWVIVVSNLMAVLIQTLSAKLGIATGVNPPLAPGRRNRHGDRSRRVPRRRDRLPAADRHEPARLDGADRSGVV